MRTGVFEIDAVVVDEPLRLEAPVLPFREAAAQPRFRQLEQAVPAGQDLVAAVFADKLAAAAAAQPVGAQLPADVAQHQLGVRLLAAMMRSMSGQGSNLR